MSLGGGFISDDDLPCTEWYVDEFAPADLSAEEVFFGTARPPRHGLRQQEPPSCPLCGWGLNEHGRCLRYEAFCSNCSQPLSQDLCVCGAITSHPTDVRAAA